MARTYSDRDKYLKLFAALMSSGTVASWSIWIELTLLWQGLLAIAAVVAVATPILGYTSLVANMTELRRTWFEIRIDYENLWDRLGAGDAEAPSLEEFERVREKEVAAEESEAVLPRDQSLIKQCYQDVLAARDLEKS